MSLIGVGSATRKRYMGLAGAYAKADQRERELAESLEAAQGAQRTAMIGQGAGIGSMYGLNKAFQGAKETKEMVSGLDTLFGGSGTFDVSGGGLNFTATDGSVVEGVTGVNDILAGVSPEAAGAVETAITGAEGAAMAAETAAGVDASVAATAQGASSSGFLGTLSSVAAPIAIGAAAMYFLSELLD